MGWIFNSVSFAVAVACFIVIRLLRKRDTSNKKTPWLIVPALALIGGSALAATVVGSFISGTINSFVGSMIVGVAILALIVAIYLDLRDKKCDKVALFGLILLPILFQAGTGPLADLGERASNGINELGTNSIGRMIGG